MPVNCPPFAIGDDYYYYTQLNKLHQKIFNLSNQPIKLLGTVKLLFVTYLVNIPFYHLGYIFNKDRRYAILSVRLFNSFFLLLSLYYLVVSSGRLFSYDVSLYLGLSVSLIVFITSPFYFSCYALSSILFNLDNKKHIQQRSSSNELLRAIQMSTTAPLLLFATGFLLQTIAGHVTNFHILVLLGLSVVLYFSSTFIGLGYSLILFILFSSLLHNGEIKAPAYSVFLILCAFFSFCSLLLQKYFINSCEVSSEVFATAHIKQGFKIKFQKIKPTDNYLKKVSRYYFTNNNKIEPLVTVMFSVLFIAYIKYVLGISIPNNFALFFLVLSTFVLPYIFELHQASRIWIRGFLVIYSTSLIFLIVFLFYKNVDEYFFISSVVMTLVMLFYYYFKNSVFLFNNYERRTFKQGILDFALSKKGQTDQMIATDSVDFIYFVNLYTNKNLLFTDYIAQNNGYIENLEKFVTAFKLCGYSLDEIQKVFKSVCTAEDSFNKREITHFSDLEYMEKKYFQNLDFLVSYKSHNTKMFKDGMFINNGYSSSFYKIIEKFYNKRRNISDVYILKRSKLHK